MATWRIACVLRGEEHVFEATIDRQGLLAGVFEAPGAPAVVLDATSLRFLFQALKPACAHVPFLCRKAASGSLARRPELAEWRHLRSTAGFEYKLATDLEDPDDPGFVFTGPDGLELSLTLEGALFLRAAPEAPRVRVGALERARAGERWNGVDDARLHQA